MVVRIDKWLWAARFYKTRSMAKDAINSGHVKINEEKIKPSRKVEINQLISIKHSLGEKIIVVLALSSKRKGASEAQGLYSETDTSQKNRQELITEVKMSLLSNPIAAKPSKKQRRQIHQFLQIR
ncbi:MAG: hypothetical protein CMK36_04180 [Porticoccaceae bacterium]|nr:hypothetical protein [Porticoccaceae bacterium]